MGSFRVPLEVGPVGGGGFERLDALVDTGATYTWIPRDRLERLGVTPDGERLFVLADGRELRYPIASVRVRIDGESRFTIAVFGEAGSEPLLGVVTLEEFGLAPDPVNRRLIAVPGLLKRSGEAAGPLLPAGF